MLHKLPKNPCAICRKREVVKLCDFVTEYFWTTLKDSDGKITCDLPMCDECAKKVPGHDFCPYHYEMLDMLDNPDKELKRRTNAYRAKMIRSD